MVILSQGRGGTSDRRPAIPSLPRWTRKDAFVAAGKVGRGRRVLVAVLLIGLGSLSVGFFAAGLLPAYMWETDGQLPDPGTRCPERIATEQGWDVQCVRELTARGPIYLGKELLAGSFVFGATALVGAFHFVRRFVTWSAAVLFLVPYVLIGYPFAFWGGGSVPVEVVYLAGLAMVVGAFALAWGWNRRAVVVLAMVYVAAWIGLLAWNAERARHFLGEGM